MAAAVPRRFGPFRPQKPQIGLVHQRGGLQRLAGLLVGEFGRCQFSQLLVHQRQELFGGIRVARFDLR